MNALQKSSSKFPLSKPLQELDHKWLVNSPWLWETKIHYVIAYTICLNIAATIFTIFTPAIASVITSIFAILGFGYWMYSLWQFSIEQERGKAGKHIAQKRFGVYFGGVFLFLFPCIFSHELRLHYRDYYSPDLVYAFGSSTFFAGVGAILIQIWKQIHTKLFIYTLVVNAFALVGLALMINLSVFFVVILIALLIFGFPMLISLVSDVPTIRTFSTWKVIALASVQFYAPFLLSFVMGVFMIPFAQLTSGLIFFIAIAAAVAGYVSYVLPTFRQMHIHMQSLPK